MQDQMIRQNIIITERCRSLRQLGRNALRGKWKSGIIAVIITTICLSVPQLIFNQLFGMNMASFFAQDGYTYNMDVEHYHQLYNSLPQTSALSSIWALLMTGPFTLGLTIYFLASFRGHNVYPKDVFLGFERFGKALGLFLYQALFIFLWALLFIIPGIIASIRYSQAFFVLADDPNKSIRECMNESKFMMKGNKGKYFLLGLSFIGWAILASIPGTLLESIASVLGGGAVVTVLVAIIASCFTVPVYVYIYSTFAGFYEILSGHLIKETEPVPVTADQIDVNAPVEKIEEVIEAVEAKQEQAAPEAKAAEETAQKPEETVEQKIDVAAVVGSAEAEEADVLPQPLDEEDKYND